MGESVWKKEIHLRPRKAAKASAPPEPAPDAKQAEPSVWKKELHLRKRARGTVVVPVVPEQPEQPAQPVERWNPPKRPELWDPSTGEASEKPLVFPREPIGALPEPVSLLPASQQQPESEPHHERETREEPIVAPMPEPPTWPAFASPEARDPEVRDEAVAEPVAETAAPVWYQPAPAAESQPALVEPEPLAPPAVAPVAWDPPARETHNEPPAPGPADVPQPEPALKPAAEQPKSSVWKKEIHLRPRKAAKASAPPEPAPKPVSEQAECSLWKKEIRLRPRKNKAAKVAAPREPATAQEQPSPSVWKKELRLRKPVRGPVVRVVSEPEEPASESHEPREEPTVAPMPGPPTWSALASPEARDPEIRDEAVVEHVVEPRPLAAWQQQPAAVRDEPAEAAWYQPVPAPDPAPAVAPSPEPASVDPEPVAEPEPVFVEPEPVAAAAPAAESPKPSLLKREVHLPRLRRPSKPSPADQHHVTRVVGLRIGSSQLAAAHVSNNGTAELLQIARASLERGLVVGGEVREPVALTKALKAFFSANKLPRKDIRLGIASNRIGVRVIDVPALNDPKQFENAIRFRAQEVLPIPVTDAVLDHVVIEERTTDEGEAMRRVLLVFAHRELIARYVDVCRGAGLRLVGIDLDAFALLRALAPAAGNGTAVVAVAVGHERTVFAVSDGSVCDFTRVLEWGSAAVDVSLARALNLAPSEAEPIKRALSLDATEPPAGLTPMEFEAARAAVKAEIAVLARELISSLRFYQARPESLDIGEVLVSGGGAQLGGFAAELQRVIGAPVRIADPLARVTLAKKLKVPDETGSLAIAVGLGIES
jgi:type IV pilus assembly protein PilM